MPSRSTHFYVPSWLVFPFRYLNLLDRSSSLGQRLLLQEDTRMVAVASVCQASLACRPRTFGVTQGNAKLRQTICFDTALRYTLSQFNRCKKYHPLVTAQVIRRHVSVPIAAADLTRMG